jgi:hypothetical protein
MVHLMRALTLCHRALAFELVVSALVVGAANARADDSGSASTATASAATTAGIWDVRADQPETIAELSKRYGKLTPVPVRQGAARFDVQLARDDHYVEVYFGRSDGRFLWFRSESDGICAGGACVGAKLAKLPSTFPKQCDAASTGQVVAFTCAIAGTRMHALIYDQSDALKLAAGPVPKTIASSRLAGAGLHIAELIWVAPGAMWQPEKVDVHEDR